MSEGMGTPDYYARCIQLFERELRTMTGVNPHDYRAIEESPPLVEITDLGEIVDVLECFLPLGKRLLMASRETVIDGLKDVAREHDKLCLFGANVDNDEHGYVIRPRALYARFGPEPETSYMAIDNIPRSSNLLERTAEVGQTVYVLAGEQGGTFIDLQAGHNPLLLFPHGALYCRSKRAIQGVIDTMCRHDLQELPLFRKP